METTQIDIPEPANDLLTAETLQEIRFTFDIDHAFPKFGETPTEDVSDDKPQGWWQRFRNWLLRGTSIRRANLAKAVDGRTQSPDRP